jgi:hypothetical protein
VATTHLRLPSGATITLMDKGCWIKSSVSTNNGACVEVWNSGAGIYVRDSKHPDGWQLHFTPAEWTAFAGGVKAGEFDVPQS